MAFVPNTKIHLLSVPFENDYKNVVYWDTPEQQYETLLSKEVMTFTEFTYQRKDNIIRVPAHIDTLYQCNYVMYQNKNHSNKWFYAFITDMNYVNDGRTDITIETDVYNTWWHNIRIKPSFIEREHSKFDVFGENTVPEGLDTGEYTLNKRNDGDAYIEDEDLFDKPVIIMAVTEVYNEHESVRDWEVSVGGMQFGVYSGLHYLPYTTAENANAIIKKYDKGKADAINCIFMSPKIFIDYEEGTGLLKTTTNPVVYPFELSDTPTTLNGYTPRNKKLLQYPYSYLLVTNNQGSSAIYHNEKFYTIEGQREGKRTFMTRAVLTPGCSIRTSPYQYNGLLENTEEGINLGKYPICNWTSDVYTNWITQNGVNVATNIAGSAVTLGLGAIMMLTSPASAGFLLPTASAFGGAGTMINAGMGIFNSMGEMHKHAVIPDQARGNVNCGDVVFAMGKNTFSYMDMSIKKEFAERIDSYFDMFGYKVNEVKTPNANHRKHWWYTKTIDVNIDGEVPQKELNRFREIYNTGVTFWKNINEVEDYSLAEDNKV